MRCAQAHSSQLSAFERHEIVAACKEYGGTVTQCGFAASGQRSAFSFLAASSLPAKILMFSDTEVVEVE